VNAVDVENVDGGVVFTEIFIWPYQDIFIVQVGPFVVRSS